MSGPCKRAYSTASVLYSHAVVGLAAASEEALENNNGGIDREGMIFWQDARMVKTTAK
jgi:hypothetical protein